jgi:hypothetical protein
MQQDLARRRSHNDEDLRALDWTLKNHKRGALPDCTICALLRVIRELQFARQLYPVCLLCGQRHVPDVRCQ